MALCSYCERSEVMPFKCKFCGEMFCSDHRLPENHECLGLRRFKEERSREPEKWIYEPFQTKYKEVPVGRAPPKPLMKKLEELVRNVNTRTLLYAIIGIIFFVLILRGLGAL
ncbi:MAG: AN1-type zinc finger protein [Candidatus Hydrothermarchaeota archaeon]|nr:AN1-type zinc finger protein [Candidatus Hydrothermarchaeota archaeon]MDP6612921.1 AN1-type zinc finger protein [Candidatus Hydrothermarchaeota archaeon]